jgi:hypothetical protein
MRCGNAASATAGLSLACNAPRARTTIVHVCGLADTVTPCYVQTHGLPHYKGVAAMMQTVQQLGLLSRFGLDFWRVRVFARTSVGYGCHAGALKPLELRSTHVHHSDRTRASAHGAVWASLNMTGQRAAEKIRAGCDILGTVMGTDEAGQSCVITFQHFSGEADAAGLELLYGDRGRPLIHLKPSAAPRYKFMLQHSFDPQRAGDMERLRSRLRDAHDAALDAVDPLALRPLWALNYNEEEYVLKPRPDDAEPSSITRRVTNNHFPLVRLMRMMGALLQAHGNGACLAEPPLLAGKAHFLLRLACGASLRVQAKTMVWHKSFQYWILNSGCYSETDTDVLIVADFERNGFYFCPWRGARNADGFDLFLSPSEMRRATLNWNPTKHRFEPFFITLDAAGCEKMLKIAADIAKTIPAAPPPLPPPPLSEDERQHEAMRIAATAEAVRCMARRPTLAERDADL